jgi:O-antigen ligase
MLIGVTLAIVVALRSVLRRGFIPVLLLCVLLGAIYESGVFDTAISNYSSRGMVETGRERLWPAAVERILSSPVVGVGISNVGLDVLGSGHTNPPHNSFLWFALASGFFPFALYCAFWIQALKRSLHTQDVRDGPFRLPYLIFAFGAAMFGDSGFMSSWALLAFSVAAGSHISNQTRRLVTTASRQALSPMLGHRAAGTTALARHVQTSDRQHASSSV